MARTEIFQDDRADEGMSGLRRLLPLKKTRQPRVSLYEPQPDDVAVTAVTVLILLLILALAAVL